MQVIARFDAPSLKSNSTWMSDANGRDSNVRVRNYRCGLAPRRCLVALGLGSVHSGRPTAVES